MMKHKHDSTQSLDLKQDSEAIRDLTESMVARPESIGNKSRTI